MGRGADAFKKLAASALAGREGRKLIGILCSQAGTASKIIEAYGLDFVELRAALDRPSAYLWTLRSESALDEIKQEVRLSTGLGALAMAFGDRALGIFELMLDLKRDERAAEKAFGALAEAICARCADEHGPSELLSGQMQTHLARWMNKGYAVSEKSLAKALSLVEKDRWHPLALAALEKKSFERQLGREGAPRRLGKGL